MVEKFLARLLVVALFAAVLIVVPYSADPGAAQAVDSPVLVNVAPYGVASGSSQQFSGSVAGRAIDGNTSGVWRERSVTHTRHDDALPWWQVDLGQDTVIESITVWNRTDCCSERLSDFGVFVSETPFPVDATISELEADPNVFSYSFDGALDVTVDIPVAAVGRYVRVQKPAGTALSLAEVQVFEALTQDQPTEPDPGDCLLYTSDAADE